jgi:hypothetical protein
MALAVWERYATIGIMLCAAAQVGQVMARIEVARRMIPQSRVS